MRARARGGRWAAGGAALALALAFAGGAALAQGSIKVRLPDLSGLSRDEAKSLLQSLARVSVITSSCPGWEISPGEWMLLTATGDMLAARLGLDPAAYERRYFGRAFELLDDPGNCDRVGPEARPLLERLVAMGGSTRAVASGAAKPAAPPAAVAPVKPGAKRGQGGGNPNRGRGNDSGKGNSGQGKGGGKHKDRDGPR